ncbi:MAG: histidinol-phosphatase HisJ family protein [Clostridia bacterium]
MVNYHLHTNMSIDCQTSATDMCDAAIKAGLSHIAITDHFDIQDDDLIEYNLENTLEQYRKISEIYKNAPIEIACGIELGQAVQNPNRAKEILSHSEFDFVLASLHNMRNFEDFFFIDYKTIDVPSIMPLYYEELLEVAELSDFDSLAHFDYPKRYLTANKISLDYTIYDEQIIKIFKTLIKRDKSLELNTSGIGRENGDFMPSSRLLKLYFDVGGRNITIGTDCHDTDKITNGLTDGYSLFKEIGFDEITIYKHRKPIKIKL